MRVFFFNDTATTEIYTLSLHDALPISLLCPPRPARRRAPRPGWSVAAPATCSALYRGGRRCRRPCAPGWRTGRAARSEEHTSELQSRQYLVCRLLLEKKKTDV